MTAKSDDAPPAAELAAGDLPDGGQPGNPLNGGDHPAGPLHGGDQRVGPAHAGGQPGGGGRGGGGRGGGERGGERGGGRPGGGEPGDVGRRGGDRPAQTAIVHLVRHGEVANPRGVIYGRLPDYHLSEDGALMAKAAADYLAGRDVTVVRCSPLDRAVETAEPIAAEFDVAAVIDERLIEPWNHFEGMRFGVGDGSLRRPRHWVHLRNPFRPSWGEPYAEVAARALAAAAEAARAARGHEAACVSHQLPIWVTRLAAEQHRLWHDPRRRRCALGSVTSLTYVDDRIVSISYAEPSGSRGNRIAGA
jgi:broad specificity phosphatase PhoE